MFKDRIFAIADDQVIYVSGWGTSLSENGGFTINSWIDVDPSTLPGPIGPPEVDRAPDSGWDKNPFIEVPEENDIEAIENYESKTILTIPINTMAQEQQL